MKIEFDPEKRRMILTHRGLDLARAEEVFLGRHITFPDERRDYGESRFLTIGRLEGRMVVLAWTPRAGAHRIITMRKANEREQALYGDRLDGS